MTIMVLLTAIAAFSSVILAFPERARARDGWTLFDSGELVPGPSDPAFTLEYPSALMKIGKGGKHGDPANFILHLSSGELPSGLTLELAVMFGHIKPEDRIDQERLGAAYWDKFGKEEAMEQAYSFLGSRPFTFAGLPAAEIFFYCEEFDITQDIGEEEEMERRWLSAPLLEDRESLPDPLLKPWDALATWKRNSWVSHMVHRYIIRGDFRVVL
ncbi:MAG: hypothetical protein LBQ79_00495, partial [Deltaproteobacteria bacterium]|nr:hypothetical protein [Deltaproteobacteria bacterium]